MEPKASAPVGRLELPADVGPLPLVGPAHAVPLDEARAGGAPLLIPDRQEAIADAFHHAAPGDVVIITGKGHERSMCYGTTEYPWSDQEAVTKVLG